MEHSTRNNIIKFVGFMLLTMLVVTLLCVFVRPKNPMDYTDKRSYEANRVFDEPNDTLDVIILGHSGVYRGLSPMEMYAEYGITSYACSKATLMPWESLDFLEQVLERQSPKLVVFETDQMFYDKGGKIGENYAKNAVENLIPIIRNHASWKDWLPGENYRERSYTKGYKFTKKKKAYKGTKELVATDVVYEMGKRHVKSLEKICALCKEKNIPLMLVEVPSKIRWNYEKYNAVKAFAEQHDVEFMDCNQRLADFDFDWKNDTCDSGDHLNYYGAKKLSAFFGEYIKEHYNLSDRRGDEKYAFWQDDLDKYNKYIAKSL